MSEQKHSGRAEENSDYKKNGIFQINSKSSVREFDKKLRKTYYKEYMNQPITT